MKISKYLTNKEYRESFKRDYSTKTINRFNDVNMSMEEIYSGKPEQNSNILE